jgi:hypothetical protein
MQASLQVNNPQQCLIYIISIMMWQHFGSLSPVLIQIEMLILEKIKLLLYYRTQGLIQDSRGLRNSLRVSSRSEGLNLVLLIEICL